MDTINIHLTDMARDLQQDHSGAYRRQLLETVTRYQQQLHDMIVPRGMKEIFSHIQQAMAHARTILTTED